MDSGQLLDEIEAAGDPTAIEAARRLFELEPKGWAVDAIEERGIPWENSDDFLPWLDRAVELTEQAVGDREHLQALLALFDAGQADEIAAYVGGTVRDWLT